MKLLIIGNGQVGTALKKCADKKRIAYLATTRNELNITIQENVDTYFEAHHDVDLVINTTAYTQVDAAEKDPEAAMAVNKFGVEYLAQACKKYNLPLIHLSTDYVFDGEKLTDYSEEDAPNPQNSYGHSKLDGETALQAILEKHIILRVSWVFSETGKNFVKTIAKLCDEKTTLGVIADQYGSPTAANSIAKIIIKLCEKIILEKKTAWGIYHYSDFPATNWHQLATYVAKLKKAKTEIFAIEEKNYPLPAKRPTNSRLSNLKIKRVFDIDQEHWMPEVEKIVSEL